MYISYEVFLIIRFIKSANLKGKIEIIGDTTLTWDLGGLFLQFCLDDLETTVLYSDHKGGHCELGHFHEDTCNVINLIQEINREDKRVHITTSFWVAASALKIKQRKKRKTAYLFAIIIRNYKTKFVCSVLAFCRKQF